MDSPPVTKDTEKERRESAVSKLTFASSPVAERTLAAHKLYALHIYLQLLVLTKLLATSRD